jgi:hypothetical protein
MLASLFPAVGKTYVADFKDIAFQLEFHHDGQKMTFTGLTEAVKKAKETIQYTAVPISPNVFMVYWQEANGTTVVHIEDFANQIVRTNITTPTMQFYNLVGTLKPQ